MIPTTNTILTEELTFEAEPSRDYKLDLTHRTICGYCDQQDAMKQVIYKILNTERYRWLIYSWDYGAELEDLIGEPVTYVMAEAKRRITEALMQDERILSVEEFTFDLSAEREMLVAFVVNTIFGEIEAERTVTF